MTAPARRPTPALPERIQTVHIIGICGTAMAALAGMLRDRGYAVTGSDAMAYPPVSDLLAAMGVPIMRGYEAAHLDHRPDLVVVGNVSRADNPEAARARDEGFAFASLPEVLRLLFLPGKRGIVPTGTHGKTTTCSLLAWLLHAAGRDPSYLIGGVPANFGSNYRLGDGDVFVVEGDEYDTAYFDKVPKFWHYPAELATINNIEFDHADIYGSVEEISEVFARFAAQVEGALWVNGEDARALAAARHATARVGTFGLSDGCDVHAVGARFDERGTHFTMMREGRAVATFDSPLWGEHNLRNTLGALALALDAGVPAAALQAGLPGFAGVAKRQQIKGEVGGVVVIDDFAHHPTAVRETLRAIRGRYPERRIWAVFEAKSNTSRRAVFQADYPDAFDAADQVVLSQPWKQDNLPDAERISIPALVAAIEGRGRPVALIPAVEDIVAHLVSEVRAGDVVVGLSGSDFGGLHGKLLAALGALEAERGRG
jgi:UDP-N-acetylmuramate: L-alanyl-gamma-D-glutamyl-meso-diaminopimelate ligase